MNRLNLHTAIQKLHRKMDDDAGMMRVHSIRKGSRKVPTWALSDGDVRKILRRSFPLLDSNSRQRKQAAFWNRIIHLFFRKQMTRRDTAAEMGVPVDQIRATVQRIRNAAEGWRTNKSQKIGVNPNGRPKRKPNYP
jgi:hypothetical protein